MATYILAAALAAGYAAAYPNAPIAMMAAASDNAASVHACAAGSISGNDVPDPANLAGYFNAKEQYVSNQGKYAWSAPSATDQRGPCPGLNAMANHNYLPKNGIANIQQFIDGTSAAFGMGLDLGGFLAVFGAIFDGNLATWSIGGPDPRVPSIPILDGEPGGISGSHNNYEGDVSPTRGDLYEQGDDFRLVPSRFQDFYEMQDGVSDADSNYNLEILQTLRIKRFKESIANNPYFFNGIFSGVLVQPAAYTFIYRFMGNKSAEHPEGQLTKTVLKSFFGVTGPNADGTFNVKHGYERIPDNWYRRSPTVSPYTIPFFLLDVAQEATVYPQFVSIGGNQGKVNTYTAVDLGNLTGSAFQGTTLPPKYAGCFAFQALTMAGPHSLSGIFNSVDGPMNQLKHAVSNALGSIANFGCPQLSEWDAAQFQQFPGYKRSAANGKPKGSLLGLGGK